MIEFQPIYAELLGISRLPSGRYPERLPEDDFAIPLTSQIRLGMIAAARAQEVAVVMTNSDGDRTRRNSLLGLLGPGSRERVIDPGFEIVAERLSVDGLLSDQCRDAVSRWYGRIPLGGFDR